MATVDEVIDGHLWAALFDIIDKEYLRYIQIIYALLVEIGRIIGRNLF